MGEVIHGLPTLIIDYNYVEKNYPILILGLIVYLKIYIGRLKKPRQG
jgi:hypothetical protein